MTDVTTDSLAPEVATARPKRLRGQFSHARRLAFWVAAAISFTAAAVAVLAPEAAGPGGVVLLGGVAAAAFILIYAVFAGEAAARWLAPAALASEREPTALAGAAGFEALADPAIVVDRGGVLRIANHAYRELARRAGAMGDSGRPPGLDRVFGGHPTVSSAVYRLARAARDGEAARERLPTPPFAEPGHAHGFEVDVSPLPGGDSLWRLAPCREPNSVQGGVVHVDPLLHESPVGVFSAAPDGKILYMNATLRGWLGFPPDAQDLKLSQFVAGDVGRVLGKHRRPGVGAIRSEVILLARDGIQTPATILTAWPAVEGKPASRCVVFGPSNTGAPPAVAQAMAAPEGVGLLDAMFANAPFGVARLDGADPRVAVIEDANPALLEMAGVQAAPGALFLDLFDIEDPAAREAVDAYQVGDPVPLELALKRESGGTAHIYLAHDRGGRTAAFLIDVSRQKELERQLFQSQKLQAIGQFAGGIAHDMNNFLQTVRYNTDSLLVAHPIGDSSHEGLNEINQSVDSMAGLVRQILTFARQQVVRPKAYDLSEILSDTSVMLNKVLDDTIRFEVKHGRDAPWIKVDRPQFDTTLMNLCTNARDAMRANGGGTLTIRTRATDDAELRDRHGGEVTPGHYAVVEVSDTGSGIPADKLAKIFDPFYTTKELGKGTGLGLSMVFGMIKQAGGHILVDSTVGVGTTFRLYFPAHEPMQSEVQEVQAAKQQQEERKRKPRDLSGNAIVLLVEDNEVVRAGAAMTLKRSGYTVIEAEDGEEALAWLEEHPDSVDIMISDVMMPGLDGPALLREGRKYLGDAAVIFVSGYAEDEIARAIAGAENDVAFMSKPVSAKQLSEKVKELLGA